MSKQRTNFNIRPYFDDYKPEDNFQKILFKAGFPIQARELNSLQGILQNQINCLSTNILKDGTVVVPGELSFNLNSPGILVRKEFNGIELSVIQKYLKGIVIRGKISGIRAKIIHCIDENTSSIGIFTLYIKIFNTSVFNNFNFLPNEILEVDKAINIPGVGLLTEGTALARTINENPNIVGSLFSLSAGVYYVRGYFVNVPSQITTLSHYDSKPTCKVGLSIEENIIDFSDDSNLLDNADGFEGYNLPGADRFQIKCILDTRTIQSSHDFNFIELARFRDGVLEEIKKETEYNIIGNYIANRFSDINGNLVIKNFEITYNDIIDNKVELKISPGIAYIDGYKIEKLVPEFISLDISKNYNINNNEIISVDIGESIRVKNLKVKNINFKQDEIKLRNNNNFEIGTCYIKEIHKTINDDEYIVYFDKINLFSKITFNQNISLSRGTKLKYGDEVFYVYSQINSNTFLVTQLSGFIPSGHTIRDTSNNTYTIQSVENYNISDIHNLNSINLSALVVQNSYKNNYNKLLKLRKDRPKRIFNIITYREVELINQSNLDNSITYNLSNGRQFDSGFKPILFDSNGNNIRIENYSYQNNLNSIVIESFFINQNENYILLHREKITNEVAGVRNIKKASLISLTLNQNNDVTYIGIPGIYHLYGIYNQLPEITFEMISGTSFKKGEYLFNKDKSKKAVVIHSTNNKAYVSFISNETFNIEEFIYSSETNYCAVVKSKNITENLINDFIFNDGQNETDITYPYLRKLSSSYQYNNLFLVCNLFETTEVGIGFTVSSYNQDSYQFIPEYEGNGLFDYFDLRPVVKSKVISGIGTIDSPYIFDNNFDYENKMSYEYSYKNNISYGNNILIYDSENYIDSVYTLYINNLNRFEYISNENLELNSTEQNRMILGFISIKGNAYKEKDVSIEQFYYKNYQMKDIEKLEKRIEKLENTIFLTKLEQDTLFETFEDALKLRTGILVEDFMDDKIIDKKKDNDYSIDYLEHKLYPSVYNRFLQSFDVYEGEGIKFSKKHNIIIKEYTNDIYCSNDIGNRITEVNNLTNFKKESLEILTYGDCWVNTKTTSELDKLTFNEKSYNSALSEWFGQQDSLNYTINNKIIGSNNRFIIKRNKFYLRSQLISFRGYFLNGNTEYDIFFKNVNMNQYCIPSCVFIEYNQALGIFNPGDIVVFENGLELKVISPNKSYYYSNPYGTAILKNYNNYNGFEVNNLLFFDLYSFTDNYSVTEINGILEENTIIRSKSNPNITAILKHKKIKTDSIGNLSGFVYIPEHLKQFEITDTSIKLELKSSTTPSSAESEFNIYGMPRVNKIRVEDKDKNRPNLVQIFESNDNMFISKLEIGFSSIEPDTIIEISIREVNDNEPSHYILPFSRVIINESNFNGNNVVVDFDIPVYISKNKQYGICFKSTGEFNLKSTYIGDTFGTIVISQVPYLKGLLKLDINGYVHSPYEMLNIFIYRAKFNIGKSMCRITHKPFNRLEYGYRQLSQNPLKITQNSNIVEIFVPHHGFYHQNKVFSIRNVKSELEPSRVIQSNVTLTKNSNAIIRVDNLYIQHIRPSGLPISSSNPGFIIIKGVTISFTDVNTSNNTLIGCKIFDENVNNLFVEIGDIVEWGVVCGIPLHLINKNNHLVTDYTFDSIKITIGNGYVASKSGRVGGSKVIVSENIVYNKIIPNFSIYQPPTSKTKLEYKGIKFSYPHNFDNKVGITNHFPNKTNTHILAYEDDLRPEYYITFETTNDKISPICDLQTSGIIYEGFRHGNYDIRAVKNSKFYTKIIDTKTLSTEIRVLIKADIVGRSRIRVFSRTTTKESGGSIENLSWNEMPLYYKKTIDNYHELRYDYKYNKQYNIFQLMITIESDDEKSYCALDNLRVINYV